MNTRILALAVLLGMPLACASQPRCLVRRSASAHRVQACPSAPALEWYVGQTPLGLGGHIVSATVLDEPPALVMTTDFKGSLAVHRRTEALAQETVAARARDPAAPAESLTVVLDGVVIAVVPVVTALRGQRFRMLLDSERPVPPLGARLQDAIAVDVPCFSGRPPPM